MFFFFFFRFFFFVFFFRPRGKNTTPLKISPLRCPGVPSKASSRSNTCSIPLREKTVTSRHKNTTSLHHSDLQIRFQTEKKSEEARAIFFFHVFFFLVVTFQ